jgi:penicillin-binding protein 2
MRLEQFRDQSGERRVVRQRLVIASVIIGLLFFGLVGQLIYLQVGQHEQLSARSQDNRVRIAPLSPTRGIIYDRNGEVLADNQAAFRLSVIPEQVDDMPALLSALDNLIGISAEERAAFAEARAQARHFQQIPLKSQLTEQQVGRLAVNRHRFPGVEVEAYLSRHYPYASTAAHVVGYVGRITRDELRQRDQRRYRGTSLIGKTGIERIYEHELRGAMGIEHIESNALGRSIRVLDRDPPIPGADIHLTLDIDLQQAAEQALGDFRGAIVALDPRDGAVLALASQPGFNPNALVQGIDREAFEQLSASPTQPLFNRALSGRYPPGSTIKPFLGLAGAASGHLDPNATMFCNGTYELPDVERVWRDWKPEGHGRIDLIQAVAQSCDIYYYDLAHRMGIDSMHQWMSEFGFGALTGIDLPGERAGIMPSREWKRATLDASWYRGETINTGIGQGFTLSTPPGPTAFAQQTRCQALSARNRSTHAR